MSRQFLQIILAALIILHTPTSLSLDSADDPYQSCALSTCGKIQGIGYPFWGINRPDYCGYPGFGLDCIGSYPVITINQQTYSILDINSASRTLRISRHDYLQRNICPTILLNTTLDSNLLEYTTPDDTLTLYYGCPVLASSRALHQFNCSINSTTSTVVIADFGGNLRMELCNNSVVVPVNGQLRNNISTEGDLLAVLSEGFGVRWSTGYDSLCQECQTSGGLCGHNTSRNGFSCYCQDRLYATNYCPQKKKKGGARMARRKGLTALSFAVYTTIVVCILLIFFTRKGELSSGFWKSANCNEKIETFIMIHDSLVPKRFSYSEIKKMTNMFNNKLGEGGFGSVYKGKLQDGRLVAVKVLSKSKTEGEEFINEVASISKTSHKNVVALLGFCYDGNKRALVYEYMPNGSLDKYIYREKSSHTTHHLEWEALYEIAIGIARGLEYLHLGCTTRIVHFDIKPHNILLDEKFCPKISDFGLAKLCKSEESRVSMTGARGTVGYIAPEVFCRNFGGVSCKSDVYSYGMMVLEMVGGRRNVEVGVSNTNEVYFPDYVYDCLQEGNVTIFEQEIITDEVGETMKKMVLVGLWCIQFNPSDRPSMTKVVEMFEGSLQSLQLPPKPFPSSPKRSVDSKSST